MRTTSANICRKRRWTKRTSAVCNKKTVCFLTSAVCYKVVVVGESDGGGQWRWVGDGGGGSGHWVVVGLDDGWWWTMVDGCGGGQWWVVVVVDNGGWWWTTLEDLRSGWSKSAPGRGRADELQPCRRSFGAAVSDLGLGFWLSYVGCSGISFLLVNIVLKVKDYSNKVMHYNRAVTEITSEPLIIGMTTLKVKSFKTDAAPFSSRIYQPNVVSKFVATIDEIVKKQSRDFVADQIVLKVQRNDRAGITKCIVDKIIYLEDIAEANIETTSVLATTIEQVVSDSSHRQNIAKEWKQKNQ
ncbi:hypothetical protein QVD17_01202 [Tagetes erecta]|uniref:Uncharacterized protein n=1 Tax=Tagetes erecta TaxID=13708 RepID=A0AAD8P7Q0_TARER|nr:hypothetical protein QVD17_01202 [Tagetes erecta]